MSDPVHGRAHRLISRVICCKALSGVRRKQNCTHFMSPMRGISPCGRHASALFFPFVLCLSPLSLMAQPWHSRNVAPDSFHEHQAANDSVEALWVVSVFELLSVVWSDFERTSYLRQPQSVVGRKEQSGSYFGAASTTPLNLSKPWTSHLPPLAELGRPEVATFVAKAQRQVRNRP